MMRKTFSHESKIIGNKMRKLGIIQPGKIGDIIICLPIAKWYYDKGYEIIWPIDSRIMPNFIGYVNYVTFVPISFNCDEARAVCLSQSCNTIIDVSFTIPGGNRLNTDFYLNQSEKEFDEVKFNIAGVPFEEKWNLIFTRNKSKELELYNRLVDSKSHAVVQWNGSNMRREIRLDNPQDHQIIEILPLTESVFDWLLILEKASFLVLIDSSVANLVEQMGIKTKKYLLTRQKAKPTLHEEWIVV